MWDFGMRSLYRWRIATVLPPNLVIGLCRGAEFTSLSSPRWKLWLWLRKHFGAFCLSTLRGRITQPLDASVLKGASKGPFLASLKPSEWPRHPGS